MTLSRETLTLCFRCLAGVSTNKQRNHLFIKFISFTPLRTLWSTSASSALITSFFPCQTERQIHCRDKSEMGYFMGVFLELSDNVRELDNQLIHLPQKQIFHHSQQHFPCYQHPHLPVPSAHYQLPLHQNSLLIQKCLQLVSNLFFSYLVL